MILWFAFRFLGPDIKRMITGNESDDRNVPAETAAQLPELRRLVLCDRVEQGQPVGERSKFSRSKDKLATLFTAWAGEPRGDVIQFTWRSPSDKELTGAHNLVRLPAAPQNFLVVGELPIGEFTEPGKWSVEVLVEDKTVSSYEFTVEP